METTEELFNLRKGHQQPMASVASHLISQGLKRLCSAQSFENSSEDSLLDMFGEPVYSSRSEDVGLSSRSVCAALKTEIQSEAQVTSRQVCASSFNRPVSNYMASENQCGDKTKDDIVPCIEPNSSDKTSTGELAAHPTGPEVNAPVTTSSSKPLDARPKVFAPHKDHSRSKSRKRRKVKNEPRADNLDDCDNEQITTRSKEKTRNKKKKVRTNANKKWKPVDITEFGFNFSLVSRPDESVEHDVDKDTDAASPAESEGVCSGDNACSDAEFFLSLGINVFEDYGDSDLDHLLNWDGVALSVDTDPPLQPVVPKAGKIQESSEKKKNRPNSKESKATSPKQDKDGKANVKLVSRYQKSYMRHVDNRITKNDKHFLYELECSSKKKVYIRRDKHRRVEKAHKAVKSKNYVPNLNNKGRKTFYMHHRLVKMHNICLDFRSYSKSLPLTPRPKPDVDLKAAKQIFKANHNNGRPDRARPAPVQNLRHTIDQNNTPNHLDLDLASFLISLQHREMTPEDYEMLLRLDDTVKPKTVSANVLDKLKTDIVGPGGAGGEDCSDDVVLCTICMDPYFPGDRRKFLPCGHAFHAACVDTWLKNSSMNCPLDGLPVDPS